MLHDFQGLVKEGNDLMPCFLGHMLLESWIIKKKCDYPRVFILSGHMWKLPLSDLTVLPKWGSSYSVNHEARERMPSYEYSLHLSSCSSCWVLPSEAQTLWNRDSPLCAQFEFLPYRIHEHNKIIILHLSFKGFVMQQYWWEVGPSFFLCHTGFLF